MSGVTILDACAQVLDGAGRPMTADEIYDEVVKRRLYEFSAKDPRAILRGTLRKHLRSASQPRLKQVDQGRFVVVK